MCAVLHPASAVMEVDMRSGERRCARGFAYVTVLALIALMSLGLAMIGPVWELEMQREREAELLRVGPLYAAAISAYYRASPGGAKHYPPTLDVLLEDRRYVGTVRHLRYLYRDPLSGRPWGLVRAAEGGIRGIYSQSAAQPVCRTPVAAGQNGTPLPAAQRYSQWIFLADPDQP